MESNGRSQARSRASSCAECRLHVPGLKDEVCSCSDLAPLFCNANCCRLRWTWSLRAADVAVSGASPGASLPLLPPAAAAVATGVAVCVSDCGKGRARDESAGLRTADPLSADDAARLPKAVLGELVTLLLALEARDADAEAEARDDVWLSLPRATVPMPGGEDTCGCGCCCASAVGAVGGRADGAAAAAAAAIAALLALGCMGGTPAPGEATSLMVRSDQCVWQGAGGERGMLLLCCW